MHNISMNPSIVTLLFQATKHDYHIEIIEPNTPWKFKARELVK